MLVVQLTVCLVILMFPKSSVSQQKLDCINLRSGNSDGCFLTVRTIEDCRQWSPLCNDSGNDLSSLCEGFSAGGIFTTQKVLSMATTVTVYETSTLTTGRECEITATTTNDIAPPATVEASCTQTQKIPVTVTTTITANFLQDSSTFNQTSTQPPCLKTNKDSRSLLAAMGVITGILLLSLVGVTAGWMWMVFALKKKLTKISSPVAVRLQRYTSEDKHQQSQGNPFSSDHPNDEPANDVYAEVADRLATIHTKYLHKEQQPVPRQGRRESIKPLIQNEYQVQEQSHERESGVDHDYRQILEHPDEETQEGNTENHYHVLECSTKPSANGETETAATAAALYEVLK